MTITIGYWDIRGVSIILQIFLHTIFYTYHYCHRKLSKYYAYVCRWPVNFKMSMQITREIK